MADRTTRILIVDDEASICEILEEGLSHAGYQCVTAHAADAAAEVLQREELDIVGLDIAMPGKSGMDFLPEITRMYPDVAVLMLSGYTDGAGAVRAMQGGAYDYMTKPISLPELIVRIEHAQSLQSLRPESRRYQNRLQQLVDMLTSQVEQRQREVEALNKMFQSHLSDDLAARDAYTALKETVSSFYTDLEVPGEDAAISGQDDRDGDPSNEHH